MFKGNDIISSVLRGSNSISKIMFNNEIVWRKGLLPEGYTECEYLESTGVQYIDTNIKCSKINYLNYEMEAYMQNLSKYTDQNQYALIGAYEVGKSFQFGMNTVNTSEERITMNMSFDTAISYTELKLREWRKLYASNEEQKVDNTIIGNKQSLNQFTDLTFYLFARNGENTYKQLHKERISYLYIKSNGKIILNLIPCLNNNSIPCMYDTVSKQTFYNQGEGEFVYKLKYPKLITESKLGFPASNGTSISTNSTYPYSYYFNDIYLEKGKKYKITFYNKRVPSGTDDGTPRFRLINEDGTFYASIAQATFQNYWDVESIKTIGNWYGCQEIIFTPKVKSHYLRLLIIVGTNAKVPPNFYLKSIEEL